jgi:D-3-phosphoglycerate dehydrogenase
MADRPVVFFDPMIPENLADLIEGLEVIGPGDDDLARAEAVVCGVTRRWDADLYVRTPNLRVVSRSGIGYDNVSVADAARFGIVVCNAPEAPSVSTAEHTVALMLAITKNLPALQARAKQGRGGGPATALELDGAVLGVIGLGRIGARVARVGAALGMQVLGCDPYLTDGPPGVTLAGLDEIYAASDVISLHAPATAETAYMINAETLASMKPGVYLVNCARGSLVHQDALLAALDSGHVAGAALDVTEPEPLPAGHPLLEHARVIVTPHMASSTQAGRRRLYEHAIRNAVAVLHGEPCASIIPPA